MNKSEFFKMIYKSHKDGSNEEDNLDKAIEEFQSLEKLFKDNEFLDIDDNTLKKCFGNLPKDKQEYEINELGKIFDKKNILVSELLEKLSEKYIFKALLKIIKNYNDQLDINKIKNKKENERYKIDKNKIDIENCKNELKKLNLDGNDNKKYKLLNNLNENWEIILILSNDKFKNNNNNGENCVKNC